jgi:hypothetical protein
MCARESRARSRRQLLAANQGAGHAARRLVDFLAARRLRCARGLRGEDRTAGVVAHRERLTKEAQVTAYLGGVHHQQRIRLGASHHKQDSKDNSISGKTKVPHEPPHAAVFC